MTLSLVPMGNITQTLGAVVSYLLEAAERTRGRSVPDDIIRAIYSGHYSLWVVFDADERKVHGCFVTEIKAYPQCKMLTIQHCVIDEHLMETVEELMQDTAARFAADCGCAGIEFVGRPGWKKHAEKHGYTSHSVVYTKMLEVAP